MTFCDEITGQILQNDYKMRSRRVQSLTFEYGKTFFSSFPIMIRREREIAILKFSQNCLGPNLWDS